MILFWVKIVVLVILGIASYFGWQILTKWDFKSTTLAQYNLEKKTYFFSTAAMVFALFCVIELPYFIFVLENLSHKVPGAMCAAGVINGSVLGVWVLGLKIVLLFLSFLWLILHSIDRAALDFPLLKKTIVLFFVLVVLFALDFILEIIFFKQILSLPLVTCCSIIFGADSQGLFSLNQREIFYLFLGSMCGVFLALSIKKNFLIALANILALIVAYYAIIRVFGVYIYELPSHICPFCLFKQEYYFVGYGLFGFLFLGFFYGVLNFNLSLFGNYGYQKSYVISGIFWALFFVLCLFYPIRFYLINRVWL